MFTFINGRSLNARLSNWSLIKQFLSKKNLPISKDLIEATMHGKDDGAEALLEQTYQLLTNKTWVIHRSLIDWVHSFDSCFRAFADPSNERTSDFTDHSYQQNLAHLERAHASKLIKNNLKISELMTDPSYAYQAKRVSDRFWSTDILHCRLLDLECKYCQPIQTRSSKYSHWFSWSIRYQTESSGTLLTQTSPAEFQRSRVV